MSHFFQRPYPSANTVLLGESRPVLVDPGSAPEVDDLRAWLNARGVAPGSLALVVNTHWHVDHASANSALQGLGVSVAAPASEAAAIEAGDRDVCRAWWLHQDMTPYRVDRPLRPGDEVEGWDVVALPGHTAAQIGLFDRKTRVLIAGDALHEADLGWLDLDADPAALDRAEATIETIAALAPTTVLSGHGPAIADVSAALDRARRRLASWRREPERIAWHACKRIFTHALMMENGLQRAAVEPYLLACPWFHDHARRAFGLDAAAFVPLLLSEMQRSGAAAWQIDRLIPTTPYVQGPKG